jgi:hypothetical protein
MISTLLKLNGHLIFAIPGVPGLEGKLLIAQGKNIASQN